MTNETPVDDSVNTPVSSVTEQPWTGLPRMRALGDVDPAAQQTVIDLLDRAMRTMPRMRSGPGGPFAFTLRGQGAFPAGTSVRYAAIVALGALHLPEDQQREVLAGDTVHELVGSLVSRLDDAGPTALSSLGDVALICWAAAETRHDGLKTAVDRLARADHDGGVHTVDAAWVVSALAAVREAGGGPGSEDHLERARLRLLQGLSEKELYAHTVGEGGKRLVPGYRAHVGCFADQVYPIQALARLGDDQAVAAAEAVAERICAAQGEGGQWWWHYDARTGGVVEGYPVYSVHQHAMAPMALLDLADAGGKSHLDAIARGMRWLTDPPETGQSLLPADAPVMTWRKVARKDPRKAVRGVRAATTRLRSGWRIGSLDRVFPPVAVDRECRPYELGWLLHTWLVPTTRE
ncbi:hypothetical protein J4573_48375 [Actinomadura barringtoniae]|uniref:Uncharacterized protein n=1 Tax=Actinomadura barringtoniae TaxID=1427535 RepID=A0A939PL63_9ACTN|nr:hypothetical protein [Actinomadura barringtoniae]MBO2454977.1 hypothetical protein [Actinomadura barringtoniae]